MPDVATAPGTLNLDDVEVQLETTSRVESPARPGDSGPDRDDASGTRVES